MLIEFNVTNYRSFKDTQTLSMAASRYFHEMEDENSFEPGINGLPRMLRSIAIYGPNASGKSNLVAALSTMRRIVLTSAKETQEGETLPVVPFMLDSNNREKGTEFEITFIEGDIRYQYGFSLTKERVMEEWLIAYPEGRPQRWFERTFDPVTKDYTYEFSTRFLGGRMRQDWRKATRGNALFLSVAVQLNSEQLKPIFLWFQQRLGILSQSMTSNTEDTATICKTKDGKEKVLKFLASADLGIVDIQVKTKKFTSEDLKKSMPAELKKHLRKKLDGEEINEVKLFHKGSSTGKLVPIELRNESAGTVNLFSFAGPWLRAPANKKILVVDDLDSSLHPLIVHQLIKMLHRSGSEAQLVFTTHDTTILNRAIMRRDQVWFIERDKEDASRLYPLSDFKVRGKEALERGYLMGRYGAIPDVREFIDRSSRSSSARKAV